MFTGALIVHGLKVRLHVGISSFCKDVNTSVYVNGELTVWMGFARRETQTFQQAE